MPTLRELASDENGIALAIEQMDTRGDYLRGNEKIRLLLTLRFEMALDRAMGKMVEATDRHRKALNKASKHATICGVLLFIASLALVGATLALVYYTQRYAQMP